MESNKWPLRKLPCPQQPLASITPTPHSIIPRPRLGRGRRQETRDGTGEDSRGRMGRGAY